MQTPYPFELKTDPSHTFHWILVFLLLYRLLDILGVIVYQVSKDDKLFFKCQQWPLRPNKKILSFPVTRPTHVKKLRPKKFYETFGPKQVNGPFFLTKNASRVHFSWFVQYIVLAVTCFHSVKMSNKNEHKMCVYNSVLYKIVFHFPTDRPEKIS